MNKNAKKLKYKKGYKANLLKSVVSQIQSGDSFALMGMPGIGKTDFFQTLQQNKKFWKNYDLKPPQTDFLFIFLDLTNLLTTTPLEFYKLTLHETTKVVTHNTSDKELKKEVTDLHDRAFETNDLFLIFDAIKNILYETIDELNLNICILIDDFAKLKDFDSNFFNSLKAIRYVKKNRIIFGFSSDQDIITLMTSDKLDELYDTFLNYEIVLKPLSEKSATLVMDEWEEQWRVKIPKSIRPKIFKYSGGQISYMKALNKVYQESGKDPKVFAEENIEKLAKKPSIVSRSEKFRRKLSRENRDIIIEVIKDPSIAIESIPRFLTATGIIKKDKNGQVKLFSPLQEEYVKARFNRKKKFRPIKKGIVLDRKSRKVLVNGEPIRDELTSSEYKILSFFVRHPRELVTREMIAKTMWGNEAFEKYSDWAIDRAISRLRKKIGDSSSKRYIRTLRGRGFRFENK